jgi:hypothetical protein
MPLAPVGLALPSERFVLGAVPQLMLLYKVNAQDKWLVEIRDKVKVVLDKLFVNFEVNFVQASHG